MNLAAQIASIAGGLTAVGAGLYKLGTGLTAMSQAIKDLAGIAAGHEARIKALEGKPAPPAAR